MIDVRQSFRILTQWATSTHADWFDLTDHPGLGCYGTGYDGGWGVQTNQQFTTTMAVLAHLDDRDADQYRARALASLRFGLMTHKTGDLACTDGRKWGRTWHIAEGLGRLLSGIRLLESHLSDADRQAIDRVVKDQAQWITEQFTQASEDNVSGTTSASVSKKTTVPLATDPESPIGKNTPHANLANGAFLWRVALRYPDDPQVETYKSLAEKLLFNAICTPQDADHPLYVKARFSNQFTLNHHGHLNVGHMVACLAEASLLHLELNATGQNAPASLNHHLADLWQVVKRMLFTDGRLCHVGGDTEVRYAASPNHLLMTFLLAASRLNDGHSLYLIAGQLQTLAKEQQYNEDGSFFGKRLAYLRQTNPFYLTKLESDRACALALALVLGKDLAKPASPRVDMETAIAGLWEEAQHGVVLHRSPTRLCSVSWRAASLAQATCLPPDDGHMGEWSSNLCSVVHFMGDHSPADAPYPVHRQLKNFHIDSFEGGFATCGRIAEGIDVLVDRGWISTQLGTLQMAFVALPDEQTMVGLHHCRIGETRAFPAVLHGMHLNLPNDLFNGHVRTLTTGENQLQLATETLRDETLELDSAWANIDHRLAIIGIYGSKQLHLKRSLKRAGGKYQSLHTETFCWGYRDRVQAVDPYSVILDIGFAVVTNLNAQDTQSLADKCRHIASGDLRSIQVMGQDGYLYVIAANFGPGTRSIPVGTLWPSNLPAVNLTTGQPVDPEERTLRLGASCATIWRLEM